MSWIRAHPYAMLFALAGLTLLLLSGATSQRNASPVGGPVIAISAGNIAEQFTPANSTTYHAPSTPTSDGTELSPSTGALPGMHALPQSNDQPAQSAEASPTAPSDSDFLSVLEQGSAHASSSTQSDTIAADALLRLAQSFTIGGIAPSTPQPAESRTPDQQALFEYGNTAGLVVLTFENAHPDMGQTLQNWIDHRTNAGYQSPVVAIGHDMDAAGTALQALPNVPQSAKTVNDALGQSFKAAASQLNTVVSAAGSDSSLAGAMKTYDATADQFTKNYLAIADLFTLHEVSFGQSDPGAVFQFSQQ